ncbi:NTF2 fold immunity protein [Uliginosibacterium gangwonense]|uniref:NTF2 fold immunity protein n=1 Tax=Uliginosibacterium gangwonense TaxID=392736 RepID=UPI00037EF0F2|nr:NTF2 fold immunity protein [Uliginosibacterium gangwonense]
MKRNTLKKLLILAALACFSGLMIPPAYSEQAGGYHPSAGVVPNEYIAIGIAEAVLFAIYGKENIERQKPYKVTLLEGVWTIEGCLPQSHAGGTFFIQIDKKDGAIRRVMHGK